MSPLGVRPRFLRGALLFVVAFLIFSANGRRMGSGDSTATALLPFALLSGDGWRLDRFVGEAYPETHYAFQRARDGSLRNAYPPGAGILATPFYLPALLLPELDPRPAVSGPRIVAAFEKAAAAGLAALAGVLLLLRLELDLAPGRALCLASAFCLATPVWSVSSQSLFQHAPAAVLLAGALLALGPAELRPARAALAGTLAGGLLWVRPATALVAAALAGVALLRGRRTFTAFAVPASLLAGLLLVAAWSDFGDWRGGYGRLGVQAPRWELLPAGFAGLVASHRGLLFAAPYLPLLFLPWRRPRTLAAGEAGLLAGAAVATLATLGATGFWDGGWGFSGRFPIDVLPILFVLGARAVEPPLPLGRGLALGALVAVAAAAQAVGAFAFPGGESGRTTDLSPGTAWSVRRSPPVLALQAGLAPPELFPLARWGAQRALPADGRLAEVRFERPLPRRWLRETGYPARLRVIHRGARAWPAWGSYGGEFATRLVVSWREQDGPGREESQFSLGGEMAPGEERSFDLLLLAPHRGGRWQVDAGVAERTATGLDWFVDVDPGASQAEVRVVSPRWLAAGEGIDWPPPGRPR